MTDLEMTRLCAEAMGAAKTDLRDDELWALYDSHWTRYDPLHDDAQALALVARKHIDVVWRNDSGYWKWHTWKTENLDLNRAIVECCARLQAAKVKA